MPIISGPGGGASVTQYDYVEITALVTVTATADGNSGGTAVIDGNAVTFSGGTRVCIEVYAPVFGINPSVAGHTVFVNLYDGTTDLGRLAQVAGSVVGVNQKATLYARRYLTPSAGAHTYHIRSWKDAAGDTATISGGAGGASTVEPGFYRITSA